MIAIWALTLAGCNDSSSSGSSSDGTTSVSIEEVAVPAVSSFLLGENDDSVGSVSNAYYIAKTEVPYGLWKWIYDWATSSERGAAQYVFANPGTIGSNDSGSEQQPVTNINWRDAMVWCNALTEYYNAVHGTSYVCVYCSDAAYATPIRTSTNSATVDTTAGTEDNPYINPDAKGFRLPTCNEWELAARYIKDEGSDGILDTAGEYYPGDYASGADVDYDDTTVSVDYDGDGDKQVTGDVAVCDNASSSTVAVMSKSPNALGLYDMSGNVWEFCFEWFESNTLRVMRGGSYDQPPALTPVGFRSAGIHPGYAAPMCGFRPVRTQ